MTVTPFPPSRPQAPAANDPAPDSARPTLPAYAELHCRSDFSFLQGAASAAQLFERARACGYRALAITDECSLAGIVRAWEASRHSGVRLIVGSQFRLDCGLRLVLLVQDRASYTRLCELITLARRRAPKGDYRLTRADLEALDDRHQPSGLLALWLPVPDKDGFVVEHGHWLRRCFARAWTAVGLHREDDDARRLQQLLALAQAIGLPPVAAGDVHMDLRQRRRLQDTLTAIRLNTTVAQAGPQLFANGERHLRTRQALARIYPPALLAETLAVARLCRFRLDELHYQYPRELVPAGHSPGSWLRQLTHQGMSWRWPRGTPDRVRAQIAQELELIAELRYEAYFLTVHDIVRFARSRGILCQGRGSAANSAVCFALGITEVDPATSQLLMARFISRERGEPPDIDIDFEHERREEVIQYIYAKYGRERAALTANVISYRRRSAMRDVARALGFDADQVQALTACCSRGSDAPLPQRLREAGFDPDTPALQRLQQLVAELLGRPRHLSQHVGGFVISDTPLSTLVPVENTAMAGRTVIQWNKDDLDALGLLKVDCLALGMLTAIRKCLDLLRQHHGLTLSPASIPQDDAATYAMIARADTIGTFQIESRAQMSMLPRLRPACFYDLVIQVAIVRPGPIQGQMVHPYLRRRQGREPVMPHHPDLQPVFARTLGVPLFQEQVMQLAIAAANYSPGEADQLRRSMAAWKRHGDLQSHRDRITSGLLAKGYTPEFAQRLFQQIQGFASYGFPESHAASFALITYVSCWLKCHHPAAFACALLNSQPMGFYSSRTLIQDARRHGVPVRPVDVCHSLWDHSLECPDADAAGQPARPGDPQPPALRLGLRQVRGLSRAGAQRLLQARQQAPFADVQDLCQRARLHRSDASALADAGALNALAGHRHAARWAVAGIEPPAALPLQYQEQPPQLPAPSTASELLADWQQLGLSLGPHPLQLLRPALSQRRGLCSQLLARQAHGQQVRGCGLVIVRQRPGTAKGTIFVTLEDEHGHINALVWPDLAQRQRAILTRARLLAIDGRWERVDGATHLIARRLHDWSDLLGQLDVRSRDFQ